MNKYQNAIGVIKACGLNIKGSAELLEDVKQIESTIIDALEKQIPKKPYIPWDRITKNYSCPDCEELVWVNKPYCENCGQALDWSDTKEQAEQKLKEMQNAETKKP